MELGGGGICGGGNCVEALQLQTIAARNSRNPAIPATCTSIPGLDGNPNAK